MSTPSGGGMARRLASALSQARGIATPALLIVSYHRVLSVPDPLLPGEPDVQQFCRQLDWLQGCFHILTVKEAVRRRRTGALSPRSLCITFDDGYANNAEIAVPELARRGIAATFFVASGYTRGLNMWNDQVIEAVRRAPDGFDLAELGLRACVLGDDQSRIVAIGLLLAAFKYRPPAERARCVARLCEATQMSAPGPLMMNESQVRAVADAGMEVGAHTVSHPILTSLPEDEARREIVHGKGQLEDMIGRPVVSFAYPNGRPKTDYRRTHVDMVRAAGYESAVSTAWGSVRADSDVLQLPRVVPWDRTRARYLMRLMRCYLQSPAATA